MAVTLRAIRQEAEISLESAAQALGVAASTVSRWELGQREPSCFDDLRRLTDFYLVESRRRAQAVETLVRAKGLAAGSGA